MHKSYLFFLLIFFVNLGGLSTVAQSNKESTGDSAAVILWLSSSFSFSKPDSDLFRWSMTMAIPMLE